MMQTDHTVSISPVRSPLALPCPDQPFHRPLTPSLTSDPDPTHTSLSLSQRLLHPDAHVLDPLLENLSPGGLPTPGSTIRSWITRVGSRHQIKLQQGVQTGILLLKVLSLQPDILGRRIAVTPHSGRDSKISEVLVLVALTILALLSFRTPRMESQRPRQSQRRWEVAVTAAGVLLHILALVWLTVPTAIPDASGASKMAALMSEGEQDRDQALDSGEQGRYWADEL
jgi:hypothetical protein